MFNIYSILGETLVKTTIGTALKGIILFTILCGGLYTVVVTVIGQVVFPSQANGSIVEQKIEGKTTSIGSSLIGQQFTGEAYLQGRPMTVSQLSPVSLEQKEQVAERVANKSDRYITIDLVTASASGLDPEITVASAMTQVDRIAAVRDMKKTDIHAIIKQHTVGVSFGTINTERVNVLAVNQALDTRK